MGNVTFITPDGVRRDVDVAPGTTLMQAATSQAVPGIDAECGGSLSCATCHVYVDAEWLGKLEPPRQTELDMLAFADERRDNSRLSCQIRFSQALDGIVLYVPGT